MAEFLFNYFGCLELVLSMLAHCHTLMEQSLQMLIATPVLFLLQHVHMSVVKKAVFTCKPGQKPLFKSLVPNHLKYKRNIIKIKNNSYTFPLRSICRVSWITELLVCLSVFKHLKLFISLFSFLKCKVRFILGSHNRSAMCCKH